MAAREYVHESGTLRLDTRARHVFIANTPVALAPKSYELLRILIENSGRAISKRELLESLWPDTAVEEGNLPFQIWTLRKALGQEAGALIETVPRHGYRWNAPVVSCSESDPDAEAACTSSVSAVDRHPVSGMWQLPSPRTALIGREKELANVKRLLVSADARLVTLTGAGGAGKTRLAVQVASELVNHFCGGVFFVPLASIAHPEMVPSILAEALQLRHTGGTPLLAALREHLRHAVHAPILLLADNFEHLSPAATVLSDILENCAQAKVLVTSRATLHIYGEYEYPVPGLSLPEPGVSVALEELSDYPAIRLFVQRASAVDPSFELEEENAAAVVELCRRLDGLPLAIELAAVRTRTFSPADILAKLDDSLNLLTAAVRDVPPRHQSLRNAIEWSHRLLNPAEQQLFRRLSLFTGGCTLESVKAVCNTRRDLALDTADGISTMLENSLLQRAADHGGEPRFEMLQTVREYALERLAESGDYDLTRRAHAAYFLVVAEEGTAATSAAEEEEWLRRCVVEHGNLRSAVDWLIDSKNADWAMRIGIALFPFWERTDHFAEGLERLKRILNLSRPMELVSEQAMVASCAGALAADLGDWNECQRLLAHSLSIYREAGDSYGVAAQLNRIGANLGLEGKFSEAATLLEQSVRAWKDIGEPSVAAGVICNLADVLSAAGDDTRSSALLQEALSVFRSLGDERGAARAISYVGDVARNRRDLASARRHYSESLSAFRTIGDRAGLARCHADMGWLACDAGELSLAVSHLRQALEIFAELRHQRGIARTLDGIAYVATQSGKFEHALTVAGVAHSIRRSLGARLRPFEQEAVHKTLAVAREQSESQLATAAWAAGCRMSLREALDYVAKRVDDLPAAVT